LKVAEEKIHSELRGWKNPEVKAQELKMSLKSSDGICINSYISFNPTFNWQF